MLALVTLVSFCVACAAHTQVWVQQSPEPNTEGQVENITDREVADPVKYGRMHLTDRDSICMGAVHGDI
jgi:hypothetical protein